MSNLSTITNKALLAAIGTQCLTRSALAINAGGAATVASAALTYKVDGVVYARAALAAQSIVPTHNIFGEVQAGARALPAGRTQYIVIGVNAAGTVGVVQGTFAGETFPVAPNAGLGALANMGTSFVGDGSVPDLPEGYCPIGLIKVAAGAVGFIPGVTALDAANITFTFVSLSNLPSVRP